MRDISGRTDRNLGIDTSNEYRLRIPIEVRICLGSGSVNEDSPQRGEVPDLILRPQVSGNQTNQQRDRPRRNANREETRRETGELLSGG